MKDQNPIVKTNKPKRGSNLSALEVQPSGRPSMSGMGSGNEGEERRPQQQVVMPPTSPKKKRRSENSTGKGPSSPSKSSGTTAPKSVIEKEVKPTPKTKRGSKSSTATVSNGPSSSAGSTAVKHEEDGQNTSNQQQSPSPNKKPKRGSKLPPAVSLPRVPSGMSGKLPKQPSKRGSESSTMEVSDGPSSPLGNTSVKQKENAKPKRRSKPPALPRSPSGMSGKLPKEPSGIIHPDHYDDENFNPVRLQTNGHSSNTKANTQDQQHKERAAFKPSGTKQGKIDFLKDSPSHMTFGRRLALFLSAKYAWYNPQLADTSTSTSTSTITKSEDRKDKKDTGNWDKPILVHDDNVETALEEKEVDNSNNDDTNKPSLEKAWAFFEHVTLQRHVVEQDDVVDRSEYTTTERIIKTFHKGADRRLNIAEPGEMELPTKLYSPLTTPLKQMGDFGLGYGLYFSTLRAFAMLSLCVAFLNIPNMVYFRSTAYSAGQPGVESLLKGSAICTERSWVPCPTCQPDNFESKGAYTKIRMVGITDFVTNKTKNGGGDYLNITSYLNWDGIDSVIWSGKGKFEKEKTRKYIINQVFSSETFAKLAEAYGIQFKEKKIVFSWNPSASLPCSGNCIFDRVKCQNMTNTNVGSGNNNKNNLNCYLYVGDNVSFGDSSAVTVAFVLKNDCGEGATMLTGMINYLSVFVFVVGVLLIRRWQNKLVVAFDEDEQTAQDYSITILNPPPDAHDPEEWKRFFEDNFINCKVTVCTVGVDNDELVSSLVKRREILKLLELKLPPGTPLDASTLKREARKAQENAAWYSQLFGGIPHLYEGLKKANSGIRAELKNFEEKPTTDVFVTFETEKAQREVLQTLTVGSLKVQRNDPSCLPDPKFLFRGMHVLDVQEPEEPSTIRWQELNATSTYMAVSLFATTFVTLLLVIAGCAIVSLLYMSTPTLASIVTTVFTSIFPTVARIMMDFEKHPSESSRQKWLFIKVTVFNVLVTAALLYVVNPFTATLDNKDDQFPGLIPSVHALFFSQLFLTPVIQMADIGGNLARHVFAPRAKTQEEMNLNFLGSLTYLAERYGNLMKFLFLMIWYCAVYPAAFFMGFLALTVAYFVDRFSLMRTWARTPQLGTQISSFVRNYVTPIAIVLMAVLSTYAWSGFPYDNLCLDEQVDVPSEYIGEWTVEAHGTVTQLFGKSEFQIPNEPIGINITQDAKIYSFCNQDFRSYMGSRSFPPVPKFQIDPWMTDEQEQLLNVYGWTSVAILCFVLLVIVSFLCISIGHAIHGKYKPRGKAIGINFSEVPAIDSYIPQVQSTIFAYPFLLCDIGEIDGKLFNWTDPERRHSFYDVTQDVKELTADGKVPENMFSRVKYWPPL